MKKLLILCVAALLAFPAFAQEARYVTEIIARDQATHMDFSYLVASELGMDSSPFEAYAWCDRYGSYSMETTPDAPITVRTVSHFLMRNYGVKGGLIWSAFKTPRYAWKELKANGFWKSGSDPDTVLSGRDLIKAMNKFFDMYPDAKLRNPPSEEAPEQYKKALDNVQENQL